MRRWFITKDVTTNKSVIRTSFVSYPNPNINFAEMLIPLLQVHRVSEFVACEDGVFAKFLFYTQDLVQFRQTL